MGIENSPDMAMVLRAALDGYMKSVHTAIPAQIVDYDPSTQLAVCQPLIQVQDVDEEGNGSPSTLPQVHNVPVIFPGAGGYRITFPVKAGDTMILIFSEASLDVWLSGNGSTVDPQDYHRFHLSDGVGAIPGLHPINKAWQSMPTDHASFGLDTATSAMFRAFSDHLAMGSANPSDYVALASKVLNELNALKTALNNFVTTYNGHTHAVTIAITGTLTPPSAVAGTGSGTAAVTTSLATAASAPNSVASGIVKSD